MRALQCFADALRQVDIGGRNFDPALVLVDLHDPVEWMFEALMLRFVVSNSDQFRPVRRDERSLEDQRPGRELVANAAPSGADSGYFDGDRHAERQRTIVTEQRGALAGQRVVRGREVECRSHYQTEATAER